MTENETDFSKMTTREIMEWQYRNKGQIGTEMELIGVEKQVWESTLRISMERAAEIEKLKSKIQFLETSKDFDYGELKEEKEQLKKQCDNWYKSFEAKSKGLFETMKDCHSLVQLILKLSPEHKGYLEKNYKEYL